MAAKHGHTETVRALVQLGANVNTPDNTGCTPLHNAVHRDNAAMIWTLVREGGAEIASLNHYGKNARDLALAHPGSSLDKVLQWLEEDTLYKQWPEEDAPYKTENDYNRAKETDCPICLHELKGDAIVLVPCGHQVSPVCWANMRAKHQDKCPCAESRSRTACCRTCGATIISCTRASAWRPPRRLPNICTGDSNRFKSFI
jgi:hypothetical protein